MNCPKCGAVLQSTDKFCTECGSPVEKTAQQEGSYTSGSAQQGFYTAQQTVFTAAAAPRNEGGASAGRVSFPEAIKLFFVNYVKFSGRSSRSEFWWVFLFVFIVETALNMIDSDTLVSLWSLAILIPELALTVRREHDIGRQWTRILLALIPVVGWIILIVDCAKESAGDNEFGPANN